MVEYFSRRLGNRPITKGECSPEYLRNRAYAKILSIIYQRTNGALRGKNVLEIGPGTRTKQLEILRGDGANIFSFEPEATEKLTRVSRNARDMFEIADAHKGVKFDFVFSSGVFEKYPTNFPTGRL